MAPCQSYEWLQNGIRQNDHRAVSQRLNRATMKPSCDEQAPKQTWMNDALELLTRTCLVSVATVAAAATIASMQRPEVWMLATEVIRNCSRTGSVGASGAAVVESSSGNQTKVEKICQGTMSCWKLQFPFES